LLFALFLCRVVAQPLALVVHADILPPFEAWHSGAVPYGLLFASQILILAACAWTAWRFSTGAVKPRRAVGLAATAVGGVYFAGMMARLILGATVLRDVRWFASPVPTLFHLVLAGYLLLLGRFHYVHGGQPVLSR
jgi:hypothetical protein